MTSGIRDRAQNRGGFHALISYATCRHSILSRVEPPVDLINLQRCFTWLARSLLDFSLSRGTSLSRRKRSIVLVLPASNVVLRREGKNYGGNYDASFHNDRATGCLEIQSHIENSRITNLCATMFSPLAAMFSTLEPQEKPCLSTFTSRSLSLSLIPRHHVFIMISRQRVIMEDKRTMEVG